MYTGLTDSIWSGAGVKTPVLSLNGTAITAELLSLTISSSVNGGREELSVGSVCAKTVTLQFAGVESGFYGNLLQISFTASGETLPFGTFLVTEADTRGGRTTVTAMDAVIYLLDQEYTPSGELTNAWSVLLNIVAQNGISLGNSVAGFQSVLASVKMGNIPTGSTCRTVVGWIAALCGRNAVIGRTGALEFVWYTQSGVSLKQSDCYEGKDQARDCDQSFSMLAVTVVDEDGNTTTLTPANATGVGATIENNYMTQSRLDAIWAEIGGLTYRPAELSFLGDLRLDAGDLVSYTMEDGAACTVPVMSVTHTFDGGVITQVVATGKSEALSAAGGGSLSEKVKMLMAEQKASKVLYTWTAYADNDTGAGISLDPAGKAYLGTAVNQLEETPDLSDPSVFTWVKVQGEAGADGINAITMVITSSNGCIFKNTSIATTMTAHVYQGVTEVTGSALSALGTIKWYKDGAAAPVATGQTLTVDAGDVYGKADYIAKLED